MGRGQPRFQPTPEQRSMVESMKGYGMTHLDICQVVFSKKGRPIDQKTLEKHFRKELDQGAVKANSKVAQSLFQQATGGGDWKQAIPTAGIWWSKCRMRWKETIVQENVGKDGGPIRHQIDLSGLTDEQLAKLEEAQEVIRSLAESSVPGSNPGGETEAG
jgi:hypothetical protein